MPPRRPRLAAVEVAPARSTPNLREAVDAAIAQMQWLSPTDGALADLARVLAEQIESTQARAELLEEELRNARGDLVTIKRLQKLEAMCDVTKTVGWLGPQLQGVLRDLGGTPVARKAMQPDQPVGSRLAQIRAAVPTATTARSTPASTPPARKASRTGARKHDTTAVDTT